MRIVMMGTGSFAVPTFQKLLASRHEVVALVTRPPHGGRGRHRPPPNPMRQAADHAGLSVSMPERINEQSSLDALRQLDAELFMVCDYGQILSAAALSITPLGGLNLHASLLPAYRGAAPVNWALCDGQTETGVTVIHMTPSLDAGPCLLQHRVTIEAEETAVELEARLAHIGAAAVCEAVQMLAAWDRTSPLGVAQDPRQVTRAPRLKKQDGVVDWQRSAVQIASQVRGMKPWPGTFTYGLRHDGEPLRLLLDHVFVSNTESCAAPPGTVLSADHDLLVATGAGVLGLQRVQPAGRKKLTSIEFINGYHIRPGDRLGIGERPPA